MGTHGSLLARFDHAEYRLCRRLNRGVEKTWVRVLFKSASRLGDGVIWYAVMLMLPFMYGSQGLKVGVIMLATGAVNLAMYKLLKRTFVRERPFIRHAGISLAQAPLDRYSFPSGHTLHAVAFAWQACAAFPGLGVVLVPLVLAIAASRVVLGLHYPTDVLVGALLGAVTGVIGAALVWMRVLFVSDVYFPRVNGVSTSIRTFRGDLARAGVETLLVAPEYPGAAPDSEPGILRVPSGGVPRDPEDRRFLGAPLRRVLNAELAARVDLVHIHTPFIAHYAGVRFAREHGLPVVATYHTFFEDYLHHYVPILPRRIGRFIARHFTRSQCDDVAALISPSAPMRDALLAYGVQTPIEVLPTGLPADSYVRGDGARFRARFQLPADRPVLLYVGRVAYEKNIDFLLRMFARLLKRRPAALFVIAGEGPAREHLARLARELGVVAQVRFIGYLDRRTELPDCYAAGDAFVFASRTETQGLVLLEAMAQGTPVVSTAELSTRSILTEGCGAFVVAEEEEAFAAAAAEAISLGKEDPRRRQLLAHAESWASQAMARRLIAFYEKLRAGRAATLGISPSSRDDGRGPMRTPSRVETSSQ